MTPTSNLNLLPHLLQIRAAALQAVDPASAVRRTLHLDGNLLQAGPSTWDLSAVERIFLVAVGKAAIPMAQAAAAVLGGRLSAGVAVTRHGQSAGNALPATIRVFESGHPVPDESGVAAAAAVEALLTAATARDRVLALLSGGASALLPLPAHGMALAELQPLTTLLLKSGATINEVNTVRKHLDRLKGGQMARAAAPAPLTALVLSDVVGDPLDVIASGPTVPDPTTFLDALNILQKYHLVEQAPAAVIRRLHSGARGEVPETPKPGDALFERVRSMVIGSNRLAGEAAAAEAEKLGYRALLLTTYVEGEAREAGRMAGALARGLRLGGTPFPPPACLVWGGETTVTVRGSGRGGRNQELALAAALTIEGLPGTAIMALATDGVDGPTDAAGAIVTGETAAKARRAGFDPLAALARNDAYPALQAAGDLMLTGPTGTNVNDLLVILVK